MLIDYTTSPSNVIGKLKVHSLKISARSALKIRVSSYGVASITPRKKLSRYELSKLFMHYKVKFDIFNSKLKPPYYSDQN